MGIPDHLTCLLPNQYADEEAREAEMEKQICSKLRKEYVKAVYCLPDYLTSIQSTSCKMPGQMNQKMESQLLGEISTNSYRQMIPF